MVIVRGMDGMAVTKRPIEKASMKNKRGVQLTIDDVLAAIEQLKAEARQPYIVPDAKGRWKFKLGVKVLEPKPIIHAASV